MAQLILVFFLIMASGRGALAEECPFSVFSDLISHQPTFASFEQSSEWQHSLDDAFELGVNRVFTVYMKGSSLKKTFSGCEIRAELKDRIENEFGPLFMKISVAHMRAQAKTSTQKHFAQAAEERIESLLLYPQKVKIFSDDLPENYPAGYNRMSHGVFFYLDRIPFIEWNVILIHELSHMMDDELSDAIILYNDQRLFLEVASVFLRKPKIDAFSLSELIKVQQFFKAGASRGILAEWRAWVVTSYFYLQGRKLGTQGEIPWLEEILYSMTQKSDGVAQVSELKKVWWQYLKARFIQDDEGLFQNPLPKKLLYFYINSIDPSKFEFGGLKDFVIH